MIRAEFEKTFEGWRDCARELILQNHEPALIEWGDPTPSLFSAIGGATPSARPQLQSIHVSAVFIELAQAVAYARDEDRWSLLYRLLYRLQHESRDLLNVCVDPDVHRAQLLFKSVRRDIHKMHAFVRFKRVGEGSEEFYVAWHKPEHPVLRVAAPFFVRRFGDRRWSIFTPDGSAHWDLAQLTFGPGMEQHEFQIQDGWDAVWKIYYKSIFNPARIKIKAMKTEMSPKYWSSMPEAELIPDLIRQAPQRLQNMKRTQSQAAQVDTQRSLSELKVAACSCTACPLHAQATQTVFGVGPENAEIMIVGEQPGDEEDLAGRPFVGPAGQVLHRALVQAGLRPDKIYFTNAVKHFKWEPRGKIRLHQKPSGAEVHACKPWLDVEIQKIQPKVIVALGATAGTVLFGLLPKISTDRGKVRRDLPAAPNVILTWHPSALLRATGESERAERESQLIQDLKLASCASRELPPLFP